MIKCVWCLSFSSFLFLSTSSIDFSTLTEYWNPSTLSSSSVSLAVMDTAAINSTGRGPFNIFWLPSETRCLIWKQLLCAKGQTLNEISIDPFHVPREIQTAILRTCKTIYFEAILILYGENLFRYNLDELRLHRVFPSTRVENLLRRVQLVVDVSTFSHENGLEQNGNTTSIAKLGGRIIPRGTLELAFSGSWTPSASQALSGGFKVTCLLIQALRTLDGFKKITIILPFQTRLDGSRESRWHPAYTEELIRYLGPNVSRNQSRLVFHPRSQHPD